MDSFEELGAVSVNREINPVTTQKLILQAVSQLILQYYKIPIQRLLHAK